MRRKRRLVATAVIKLGSIALCVQSQAPFYGIERKLPGLRSWGLHIGVVELAAGGILSSISRPTKGEEVTT